MSGKRMHRGRAWWILALLLAVPTMCLAQQRVKTTTRVPAGGADKLVPSLEEAIQAKDSGKIQSISDDLAGGGEQAAERLTALLYHNDSNVVEFSAAVLARIGTPAAVNALMNKIETVDTLSLRENLRTALRSVRNGASADVFLSALQRNRAEDIQAIAIEVLSAIGNEAVVRGVADLLETEPEDSLRKKAMRVLGSVADAEATHFLTDRLITTRSPWLRVTIPIALGNIGTSEAVRHLANAFDQMDASETSYLVQGLARVSREGALPTLDEMFVNARHEGLREGIAMAYGNFKSEEVLRRLDAALSREESPQVREALSRSRQAVQSKLNAARQ